MASRTSSETITFRHPFKLTAADDVQPAGRYLVETDEELLQSSSLPVYRRLSTFIRLPGRSGSTELARIIDIDPAELLAALARDAQAQETAPPPAQRTPVAVQGTPAAVQDRKRGAVEFVMDGWRRWLGLNVTKPTWTALLIGGAALKGLCTRSIGSASERP